MQLDALVTNGLTTIQSGFPAVRSIRSTALVTLCERGIFPPARKVEPQARNRFPSGFQFGALHVRIKILVDCGAVDNLRNLIVL